MPSCRRSRDRPRSNAVRDIGILVWVVLLVVGVIGSMVSSLRKQAQSPQATARPPSTTAQTGAPEVLAALPPWAQQAVAQARASQAAPVQPLRPKPPAPPPAPKAPVRSAAPPPRVATAPLPIRHQGARLFADKPQIVRAVIAAEILGKPRAFSDEYHGY